MALRRLAQVAAAALLIASIGCGGDAEAPSSASTSGGDDAAAPEELSDAERSDIEVVRRYVNLLGDGDTESALDLRCRDSIPTKRALFGDQVGRLIEREGAVAFSRAEIDRDPANFDTLHTLEDPRVVEVWLSFDGQERPEPLLIFVATDGDERRLCGYAQPQSPTLIDLGLESIVDLGPTTQSLQDLVSISTPDGFVDVGTSHPPLPEGTSVKPDALVTRTFQHRSGDGGLAVAAFDFESAEDAGAFVGDQIVDVGGDLVGLAAVTEPPDALAYQVGGFGYTWIQPAETWPLVTTTVLPYGDKVVLIQQSPVDPDGPDRVWLDAAAEVDQIARG